MKDFLTRPLIGDVDTSGYHGQPGDGIVVHLRRDLQIAQVRLVLRRETEEDDALPEDEAYRYAATQTVPAGTALLIDVTVRDTDNLEVKRTMPLVVA